MRKFSLLEDVCLVLNEREALKRATAEKLHAALTQRRYNCSRLAPSAQLADILSERRPRVLVIDYLVGDFGTALDILEELRRSRALSHIAVIVLTDEPSVAVAVSALKLGARDYLELQVPHALERALGCITSLLSVECETVALKPSAFIATTPCVRAVLANIRSLAETSARCVVLYGEHGTGRSALGRILHDSQSRPGIFRERDLRIENLDQMSSDRDELCAVEQSTLMIEHTERASSELQEIVRQSASSKNPRLLYGCTSESTVRDIVQVTEANVIEVPPLRERDGDVLPLLRHFARDVPRTPLEIDDELLNEVRHESWPGNVRELRAVTWDTLCRSAKGRKSFRLSLRESKSRWERYHAEDWLCPR